MLELPVYFVSDNHFKMDIDKFEKERRIKLYNLFDKIKNSGGTLVIGGDFFDFWFNYKFVVPTGYIEILEKLENLYHSGISIKYILGNHDFWDFGYFKKKFGAEVYSKSMEFKNNKNKIQICHGDGILKNDYGYRFMRKIIRSKLSIFLFKLIHPDLGCAIAKKISKASGDYHHHDLKADIIRKELIEYARLQWKIGCDTVLLGHYHQTGIIEENGKYLIFMGDWLRHFTVTRLDRDGWWQGSWEEM